MWIWWVGALSAVAVIGLCLWDLQRVYARERDTEPRFRVWYHQAPGPVFERDVPTYAAGEFLLRALYDLAAIRPGESVNMGGIRCLSDDNEWVDCHLEVG